MFIMFDIYSKFDRWPWSRYNRLKILLLCPPRQSLSITKIRILIPLQIYRKNAYVLKKNKYGKFFLDSKEHVHWSSWSTWHGHSKCSVSCGGGYKIRTRSCHGDHHRCSGSLISTEPCNTNPCPDTGNRHTYVDGVNRMMHTCISCASYNNPVKVNHSYRSWSSVHCLLR